MTDSRGQLSTYGTAPVDPSRISRAPRPDPTPAPSFLTTAAAGFRTAVDEQSLPQDSRLADAYLSLERDLYASGIDRRALHPRRAASPLMAAQGMGATPATSDDLLDREAAWRAVAMLRARDPKALPGLPTDRDGFERDVLRRHGGRDRDQAVLARGSMVAQIAGGLPASFLDPVNLATLPIGGAEAGLVRRIAVDALTNAGVEALQLPTTIANRKRLGEDTSAGEAASFVAMAAGFGAAVPVAGRVYGETIGRGAGALLDRNRSWAGRMAGEMRDTIGVDRMTPDEAHATRVLDREDEVLQTSPFDPGAGSAAHVERMDAARETLAAPPAARVAPIPAAPARVSRTIDPQSTIRFVINDLEGGARVVRYGDGDGGTTKYGIAAKFNPGVDVANLTEEQATRIAYSRYWLPEYDRQNPDVAAVAFDAGYIGGQKLGRRIAREADGDAGRALALYRRYLNDLADRNPAKERWRKGWNRRVDRLAAFVGGAEGDAPRLRRDIFPEGEDGDAEWRMAQADADAAEADLARSRHERALAEDEDAIPFDDGDAPVAARPEGADDDWMFDRTDSPRGITIYHGTRGEWHAANPNKLGMTFYAENNDVALRYAEGFGGRRSATGTPRVVTRELDADAPILDLSTAEGHRVLAGLDPVKGRANDLINSAREGLRRAEDVGGSESELWRLNTHFWQFTKTAEGSAADSMRKLSEAIREKGYVGVRFTDDSHKTIALFDDNRSFVPAETRKLLAAFDDPNDLVSWVNARNLHTSQFEASIQDAIAVRPEWRSQLLESLRPPRGVAPSYVDTLKSRFNRLPQQDEFKPRALRADDEPLPMEGSARGEDDPVIPKDVERAPSVEMAPSAAGIARATLAGDQSQQARLLRDVWQDDMARGNAPEPVYALRPKGGGEIVAWSPSLRTMERAAEQPPIDGDFEIARLYPPDDLVAAKLETEGFGDPDDFAAERQFDSLEHDLRMLIDEGEQFGVRMNDDGDVVSLADMMAEQDLDEAAFDAADACMRGGGAREAA